MSIGFPELRPYTYFLGPAGVTGCIEGAFNSSQVRSGIRASFVYFPDETGEAHRLRTSNRNHQHKNVFDGTPSDDSQFQNAPIKELLDHHYQIDPTTKSRSIQIPFSQIEALFSPEESLQILLAEKIPTIPEEVYRRIKTAIQFLKRNGIPTQVLGVYGGLQSFVLHKDAAKNLKDIDLTITGLEYYEKVVSLAHSTQKNLSSLAAKGRSKKIDEGLRQTRHENTRIFVPGYSDLYCDIKILRAPKDTNSIPNDISALSTSVPIHGWVTDSRETLCTPMSFTMRTTEGQFVVIASQDYPFIGSVSKGDAVDINAVATNHQNCFLLISDKGSTLTPRKETVR